MNTDQGGQYPQVDGKAAPAQEQYAQQQPQQQHGYHQPQQYAQQPGVFATSAGGPQPIPGLPVRGPKTTPAPGQTVIGYQVVPPQGGCSCDLTSNGWLVVIILILLVPCVACIPCCIKDCQQSYQEPVYGPPGSTMNVPVAQPYSPHTV